MADMLNEEQKLLFLLVPFPLASEEKFCFEGGRPAGPVDRSALQPLTPRGPAPRSALPPRPAVSRLLICND